MDVRTNINYYLRCTIFQSFCRTKKNAVEISIDSQSIDFHFNILTVINKIISIQIASAMNIHFIFLFMQADYGNDFFCRVQSEYMGHGRLGNAGTRKINLLQTH